MRVLEVLDPGPMTTIQDQGRTGCFDLGVGVSGAADRGSYALANRLVGNPPGYAGLELVLGGLRVRPEELTTVALTGAPAPARVDGRAVGHCSVLSLWPGQTFEVGLAARGLRSYLAVRGGIDVEPVLGSRSRDTLAGIGPAPLVSGDRLPIGPPPADFPVVDTAPVSAFTLDPLGVAIRLGPRDAWFVDPLAIGSGGWTVSADLDRVGVRLDRATGGARLERSDGRELASEGVAVGSVQVPPSGQPVIFLADHPTTGGYPVLGVVVERDIDRVAQARPGQLIRFRLQA